MVQNDILNMGHVKWIVPSVFMNEPGPMNVSPFSSFIVRSKIGDCKTLFGYDKIGQWYPE